jgi:hypothetical protein
VFKYIHKLLFCLCLIALGLSSTLQAEITRETQSADQAQGEFLFVPHFSAFQIDANDVENASSGHFTSKLNLGTEFAWALNLKSARLLLFADVSYFKIASPSNRGLSEGEQSLVGGGFGFGFYPLGENNKKLEIMVLNTYREQLFFRATTVSNLTMDRVTVPDIELRIAYFPLQGDLFGLGGEVTGSTIFSTSTSFQDIRNGYGVSGKILGTWDAKSNLKVIAGPTVAYNKTRTRIVEQKKLEVGAAAGVVWGFD